MDGRKTGEALVLVPKPFQHASICCSYIDTSIFLDIASLVQIDFRKFVSRQRDNVHDTTTHNLS